MRSDDNPRPDRRMSKKKLIRVIFHDKTCINHWIVCWLHRNQQREKWEHLVWLALALIPYLHEEVWLYLLLASSLLVLPISPTKSGCAPMIGLWLGWGFGTSLYSLEPGSALAHWLREAPIILGGFGAGKYLKRKPVGWWILFASSLPVIFLGMVQALKKSAYPMEWVSAERLPGVFTRITGTFGNPNLFGEYLSFLLLMAAGAGLAGLNTGKEKQGRSLCRLSSASWWFLVLVPIYTLLLYPTFSRTSWWSAIIGLFFFLIPVKKGRLYQTGVSFLILLVLVQPLYLPVISRQPDFFDSTLGYRLKIWAGTWELIKNFPYGGVGKGNFSPYYSCFSSYQADHAHNLYLQIIAEQGLFGLVILFFLLLNVFSAPTRDLIDRGVKAALFTQVVAGLTEFVWAGPLMLCLFWLGYGFLMEAGDG
jgi:O-antigen ligase